MNVWDSIGGLAVGATDSIGTSTDSHGTATEDDIQSAAAALARRIRRVVHGQRANPGAGQTVLSQARGRGAHCQAARYRVAHHRAVLALAHWSSARHKRVSRKRTTRREANVIYRPSQHIIGPGGRLWCFPCSIPKIECHLRFIDERCRKYVVSSNSTTPKANQRIMDRFHDDLKGRYL